MHACTMYGALSSSESITCQSTDNDHSPDFLTIILKSVYSGKSFFAAPQQVI